MAYYPVTPMGPARGGCHGPSGLAMTELGCHRERRGPVAICPRELATPQSNYIPQAVIPHNPLLPVRLVVPSLDF